MTSAQTFGQWLQAKREERGLTLRGVEVLTGGKLSNAAISQLETGKIENPSVVTLHRLAAALALDFAELCERACAGNRPPPSPAFCPHCGQIMRAPDGSSGEAA